MSDKNKLLLELSQDMYEMYGFTNKVGLEFFSDYSSRLSPIDPVSVISFQMKSYPYRYVMDFILASPFLWKNFSSNEWLDLMRKLSPRPDPFHCNEEMSEYCDLVFLNRYLQINGLDVFLHDEEISEKDKENVISYFRKFPDLKMRSKDDTADLDGAYFIHADDMSTIRNNIVAEGIFESN